MPMLSRQSVLGVRCEATAGTDAVPAAGTHATKVYDLQLDPLGSARALERQCVTSGSATRLGTVPGTYSGSASCVVYLCGSGTAGTAPSWSPLLLACGAKQDVTAATNVVFRPASGQVLGAWGATSDKLGHCPVTLYQWSRDTSGDASGKLAKLLGAMGDASISWEFGTPPAIRFDMRGAYSTVTIPGGSFPASFTLAADGEPVAAQGTGILSIWTDGVTSFNPICRKFDLKLGTKTELRTRYDVEGGCVSAVVTDKTPAWSMTIEEPASYSSTFDWWQGYEDATALHSIVFGPVGAVGNKWQLDIPNPIMQTVKRSVGDGIVTLEIDGTCATDSYATQDDEWSLTLT